MTSIGGRTLRSRLVRALVSLGVVSVVLLAAVNFVIVRGLLRDNVRSQLDALRDVRADTVELAVGRLLDRTSSFGLDPAVADALVEFDRAYADLEEALGGTDLTDAERERLELAYEPVVAPYDAAGIDRPEVGDLLPASPAGRYVQSHYIADNPEAERADLVDAGDGSDYSEVHARHHEYLRSLAASVGATDLMLVGATSVDVVYSVEKHVDLGTDVVSGPYGSSGLGVSIGKLAAVSVDSAALSDIAYYLPDTSAPVVHAATPVRSGLEVVGVLVVTVPTDVLTDLVTSNQDWELLGLGDTGDAYVVGRDLLLRTIPRGFFEDPDDYVERLRDASDDGALVAELIGLTGSPVLVQTVDNSVVRDAIDGEVASGRVQNGVGTSTVASAEPLDVGGLGWIIVTEQSRDETGEELEGYLWSIAIVLAILLAVLVVVSGVLASRFAKPVKPLLNTARSIADGDADVEVPDLGRNELGDVGHQLGLVAARLREQEASIAAEEQRIEQMLEHALPASLVDRVRNGERDLVDVVDSATVVAVVVRGVPSSSVAEHDALVELTSAITHTMAELTEQHGIERIKVTLERQLFVAGRRSPSTGAEAAHHFARAVLERIPALGREQGVELDARVGMSSGLVASGVLGSRQVSFDIWGAPVPAAAHLADLARPGTVLVDESVLDGLALDVDPVDEGDGRFVIADVSAQDESRR